MSVAFKDDPNQEELVKLWGSRVSKLTQEQTQMVVEVLKELEDRKKPRLQLNYRAIAI